MHLARSSSVRHHIELAGVGVRADALQVEHLATVAALVAQDLGISVVPELTLFHFAHANQVSIPVRDSQLRRSILLVRRKGKALSVAAKAMAEDRGRVTRFRDPLNLPYAYREVVINFGPEAFNLAADGIKTCLNGYSSVKSAPHEVRRSRLRENTNKCFKHVIYTDFGF